MSYPKPLPSVDQAQRRRLISIALLRSLATSLGLVVLYYLAPVHQLANVPIPLKLSVALMILAAVAAWQFLSVTRADYPGIRAVEALSVTTPLFVLLFAMAYFFMAQDNPADFTPHVLTRTDTLYFTVSTFATVGFGDITATSQGARMIVTLQMVLDLLVLGVGIRLFIGAVQASHRRQSETTYDPPS